MSGPRHYELNQSLANPRFSYLTADITTTSQPLVQAPGLIYTLGENARYIVEYSGFYSVDTGTAVAKLGTEQGSGAEALRVIGALNYSESPTLAPNKTLPLSNLTNFVETSVAPPAGAKCAFSMVAYIKMQDNGTGTFALSFGVGNGGIMTIHEGTVAILRTL